VNSLNITNALSGCILFVSMSGFVALQIMLRVQVAFRHGWVKYLMMSWKSEHWKLIL